LIATTRVGDWLAKYFPEASTGDGIRLPELLDDWVTLQRARFDLHLEVPPPLDALVLEQDDGRLVIRFLPGADTGAPDTLLLDERAEGFEPETLRALRLTRREAAVLRLVARGQTDGEIARELFVSPRTVEKHLAHIFAKLGTHSRAGAVARAFEAQLARARGFAA
jgi:DNA-binding CsgD family transcriptional regulator